ncbi:MAG: protein kinase [Kofleriaceae bacterium]
MSADSPSEVTQTVTPGHDPEATVNALPAKAAERRAAASSAHLSHQFTIATLRDEEVQTARAMIRIGRLVGFACVLGLPLLGGSVALRIAVAIAMIPAIAVGYWVEWSIRKPDRYTETMMMLLAASVGPAAFTGLLYFGIFSGAQLFFALALFFFSRRERHGSALALYVSTAIVQALLAGLVISGAVADPGLIRPELSLTSLAVGHVLIQVGDFGAFLLGRQSYRAARQALARMQRAMVLAAQREALLLEARQDLDRALRGGAGRYTDRTFGSYKLGDVIGRGGMGEVYEARHVDSGELAAAKLLAHRELSNQHSVERFLREVQAVRALTSPHVVRVFEASDAGDPIPFLMMERLRGHDLAHHLRSGQLTNDGLLELIEQVGAAVEEAWQHGIVHRDLKPQNIFRDERATRAVWKVLDFGVAAIADHDGTLTQGHVVGTPAYMAPEQGRGERVDYRADVYAVAAIAYRWLTGRPVCSGRDMRAAVYQAVHVMPQRPSTYADLPPGVDAVLAIGLAKDPAVRWERVSELRAQLEAALAGEIEPRTQARAAAILDRHPWGSTRE